MRTLQGLWAQLTSVPEYAALTIIFEQASSPHHPPPESYLSVSLIFLKQGPVLRLRCPRWDDVKNGHVRRLCIGYTQIACWGVAVWEGKSIIENVKGKMADVVTLHSMQCTHHSLRYIDDLFMLVIERHIPVVPKFTEAMDERKLYDIERRRGNENGHTTSIDNKLLELFHTTQDKCNVAVSPPFVDFNNEGTQFPKIESTRNDSPGSMDSNTLNTLARHERSKANYRVSKQVPGNMGLNNTERRKQKLGAKEQSECGGMRKF
ncbi:uncharacterized protein C8R40DRAFT_1065332 [Lentinula edodes]|uniref:uncharacterized protein n=1 Tax=Lentinula edodes TaxID=5353 RepID=UPI001E8E1A80|nr:uncharacterized protein C8R40DRAFT_1065332 [Lentinula edodes]KAH7880233.1 hypothetical protein C8R40DRAFT_1065332 [Lentinula edodes]